jgi:hypothetical protein
MAGIPRRNPPRELGRVEVQSYGVETVVSLCERSPLAGGEDVVVIPGEVGVPSFALE